MSGVMSTYGKYRVFFSHPDYTVGPGIPPDQPPELAGFTAGRESQLMLITTTPKNFLLSASDYTTYRYLLSIQLFHYASLLTLLFQAIIINPENERRFSI
jgi:hypothetical protein